MTVLAVLIDMLTPSALDGGWLDYQRTAWWIRRHEPVGKPPC